METTGGGQYLSFVVAGTDFGVPILKVKEILQYEGATLVPGAPASVRGVINVRGAVVPVVDLGVKFGRPEAALTKRSCVLVVETRAGGDALVLGVLADAVTEVVDLAAGDIEPPPSFGTGLRLEHITGMGRAARGFVILLDLDRVLAASEAELGRLAGLLADGAAAPVGARAGAAPIAVG